MTKEKLTAKIAELKQSLIQLQANANAIGGAIQFAEQLLAEENDTDKPAIPLIEGDK